MKSTSKSSILLTGFLFIVISSSSFMALVVQPGFAMERVNKQELSGTLDLMKEKRKGVDGLFIIIKTEDGRIFSVYDPNQSDQDRAKLLSDLGIELNKRNEHVSGGTPINIPIGKFKFKEKGTFIKFDDNKMYPIAEIINPTIHRDNPFSTNAVKPLTKKDFRSTTKEPTPLLKKDFNTAPENNKKVTDFRSTTKEPTPLLKKDFNTAPENNKKVTDFRSKPENNKKVTDFRSKPENNKKVTDFRSKPEKKPTQADYAIKPEKKPTQADYAIKPEKKPTQADYAIKPEKKPTQADYARKPEKKPPVPEKK